MKVWSCLFKMNNNKGSLTTDNDKIHPNYTILHISPRLDLNTMSRLNEDDTP